MANSQYQYCYYQDRSKAGVSLQDYDITLKTLSDKLPHHFVNFIFEDFNGEIAQLNKELPANIRESDCLIKVKDTNKHTEFILHLEFQSSHDANMPHRMLSYFARIYDTYKLPIYPLVMYLNPDNSGLNIVDTFVNSIYDKNILFFEYEVLKIWEIDQNRIIDNNLYGLFPILPLAKTKAIDDKQNLTECFNLVREIGIEDKVLKADIYVCTGILAGLRYPKELIESLMKVEIMEESVIYQDILNKGIEKGREKGIQKGREEGMKEGMEKSIIQILSKRFGNISPGLADIIYHAENESQLHKFIDLALSSNNLSEFEKQIQNT